METISNIESLTTEELVKVVSQESKSKLSQVDITLTKEHIEQIQNGNTLLMRNDNLITSIKLK